MIAATADGPPPDGPPPSPSPTAQMFSTASHLTLDAPVRTLYDTLLRVDVNRSSKEITDYPIKPFLRDFLQILKHVDSKNTIVPIDPNSNLGSLAMESDIPSGDKLSNYVAGISTPPNKSTKNDTNNTIRFHIRINATLPLWQLKRNTSFYEWLTKGKIFLRTHGFTTTYDVLSAGFFSNLSPTMHRRDTMKALIDKTLADKNLTIELRLVPRNIPYGQKEAKTATNAVEVLVDRASVNIVRELMIELFQTKHETIPADVYFVPSPTRGAMTHELFFNHLRLHHQYTANLRSFGIANVHDLQAELHLPQADGTTKTMTFENALLESVKPDTQHRLFKSIEPTKDTEKHGKYLLITTVDMLDDAQTFIDQALENMSTTTPDNISRITKTDGLFVTRTNRIATSARFQSYAQALQNMVPTTITTTTNTPSWKRRPPAVLNYSDDEYPFLDGTKKQRRTDTATNDSSTQDDTAGETLTAVDLDELQSAYEAKCDDLRSQIEAQRVMMENMRTELQQSFEQQIKQLELRMESNNMQLFQDFGQRFQMVMQKIDDLVVDRNEMKTMVEDKMQQILLAIQHKTTGDITPTMGNTPSRPQKTLRATPSPDTNPDHMNIDHDNQADGSLSHNPTASHANHNSNGFLASAGATK
jgi:hypothetical protein